MNGSMIRSARSWRRARGVIVIAQIDQCVPHVAIPVPVPPFHEAQFKRDWLRFTADWDILKDRHDMSRARALSHMVQDIWAA